MNDLSGQIAEATRARTRLLDFVHAFTPDQGAFKATPNEWSVAENLEHLVLAEQGAVNRVWSAADAVRAGDPSGRGNPSTEDDRSRRS